MGLRLTHKTIMKTIRLDYQIWLCCSQEIEVPEEYTIPIDKKGHDLFVDLRDKYPDHEVWDHIPDNDGDGELDVFEHLEYITTMGLDIQKEGETYTPLFSIELD